MKLLGKAIKVGDFFLAPDAVSGKYLPHQTEVHLFVIGNNTYTNDIDVMLEETKKLHEEKECSIVNICCE